MAITSLDQMIASLLAPEPIVKAAFTGEAAGELFSSFYTAGRPGAAAAPSSGLAGTALTSYSGQVNFPAAVVGKNIYLAGADAAQAGNVGALVVCDRLWHDSGFTITLATAQAVNSVAFPGRDLDGTANGRGILVGIEVSSATGNGAPVTNTTLSYTNESGTSGRTATIASFPATAVAGQFSPFALNAGDQGVRSIQSLTLGTSYVSGTIHLVAYRPIATIPLVADNIGARLDAEDLGMPRMFDNSVPFLLYLLKGTAGGAVYAGLSYAQG